jgi:hypothetical protein
MNESDDDEAVAAPSAPLPTPEVDDEIELARRAGAGDQPAFDLLYDRYFARTSWYFTTIFPQRKAKVAIKEVLTELFSSLGETSDLSFAERAYRLSLATELRRARPPAKVAAKQTKPAVVREKRRRAQPRF